MPIPFFYFFLLPFFPGEILLSFPNLISVKKLFHQLLAGLLVLQYFWLLLIGRKTDTITRVVWDLDLKCDVALLLSFGLVEHRVFEWQSGRGVSKLLAVTPWLVWVFNFWLAFLQIGVLLKYEIWEFMLWILFLLEWFFIRQNAWVV